MKGVCDERFCEKAAERSCIYCREYLDGKCTSGHRVFKGRRRCFVCREGEGCENKVFYITVKICRRCKGVLTSKYGLKYGIGRECAEREREEMYRKMSLKGQMTIFEEESEDEQHSFNGQADGRPGAQNDTERGVCNEFLAGCTEAITKRRV